MDGLSPAAWKFLQQITPALIGLLGVLVGSFLTLGREWWAARRRARKDATYLAAIVGGELDKFVTACSQVVHDPLTNDQNGYTHGTVATPDFDPSSFDVEWRSIPPEIMFQILDLPFQLRTADGEIDDVQQYADSPPDYDLTFQEREYQYALLGLHASEIVEKLRSHTGLKPRGMAGRWDPRSDFRNAVSKYEQRRAEQEKAHRELMMSRATTSDLP